MSASIFDLTFVEPNDKMLAVELGKTKVFLHKIESFIKDEYGDLTLEWKLYGQKSGWVLKMFNKKRNLLFVVPCKDYFIIVFTFGDRAVDDIIASALPEFIKHEIFIAKKYLEGRSIQLEVRTDEQCENILNLIRIKMRN